MDFSHVFYEFGLIPIDLGYLLLLLFLGKDSLWCLILWIDFIVFDLTPFEVSMILCCSLVVALVYYYFIFVLVIYNFMIFLAKKNASYSQAVRSCTAYC